MCSKGTPIIRKKSNPSLFIKGGTTKGEKKSLGIEKIYGHGSQRDSVLGMTMLAGGRQ
jgi:hypothetical protein